MGSGASTHFFCHSCGARSSAIVEGQLCPRCASGFVEQINDARALLQSLDREQSMRTAEVEQTMVKNTGVCAAQLRCFHVRPATQQQSSSSEGEECAVCWEGVEEGDPVMELPCSHYYHDKCLRSWFAKNNTCPTCRKEFPTEDLEYYEANGLEEEAAAERARRRKLGTGCSECDSGPLVGRRYKCVDCDVFFCVNCFENVDETHPGHRLAVVASPVECMLHMMDGGSSYGDHSDEDDPYEEEEAPPSARPLRMVGGTVPRFATRPGPSGAQSVLELQNQISQLERTLQGLRASIAAVRGEDGDRRAL
mmetsp:Transcript_103362/g.236857  ORF Transcript_103362/g.236857 Transcript_103362/m.236857 type:complete len:308 (+) Transcript_103362:66-989(+)